MDINWYELRKKFYNFYSQLQQKASTAINPTIENILSNNSNNINKIESSRSSKPPKKKEISKPLPCSAKKTFLTPKILQRLAVT